MTARLVEPERRLLDYARAAAYLSVSLRSFKQMAADGEIGKVPLSGRVLFDKADLDALIERKKREA